MTPRKAAVLAINLPPGAGVWAAVGSDAAWTAETHLLASAIDVLAGANWQRGGGEGRQPRPIPRPGDEFRKQGRTTKVASRAEQFRARQQHRDGDS